MTPTIVRIILALIGAGLLLGGALSFWNQKQFVDLAVRVPGIVIDNIEDEDSDGDTTYHPRFEFHRLTGEVIQVTSRTGSSPPSYRKGESVKVLYEDTDPEHAEIDSFSNLWLLPTILTGIAFSIFLIVPFIGFKPSPKRPTHKH